MLHRFLARGTFVVLGFASTSFLVDSAIGQRSSVAQQVLLGPAGKQEDFRWRSPDPFKLSMS